MKYWTIFILRMMARAGLSMAAIVWVVGACKPINTRVSIGTERVFAATNSVEFSVMYDRRTAINYHWIPLTVLGPSTQMKPYIDLLWLKAWERGSRLSVNYVYVTVDHWLLCLTFLVATVATSWRWKKPAPVQEDSE